MNQSTLVKIWTLVALAATYFCINIFVATQGGHFLLPGLKLEPGINRYAAAVDGIWFALPLVLLSYLLTLIYVRRSLGSAWYERFPCAFNLNLNYSDPFARSYQAFFLVVTLLVPAYSAGHFIFKSLDGTVMISKECISDLCPRIIEMRGPDNSIAQACARLTQNPPPAEVNSAPDLRVISGPAGHLQNYNDFTTIFTHGDCYSYENAVTFFPFWGPWLGVILVVTLSVFLVLIIFRLFRRGNPGRAPAPNRAPAAASPSSVQIKEVILEQGSSAPIGAAQGPLEGSPLQHSYHGKPAERSRELGL